MIAIGRKQSIHIMRNIRFRTLHGFLNNQGKPLLWCVIP